MTNRVPPPDAAPPPQPERLTLAAAVPTWARIAALSFGGPAGQIALMHRILVDEKKWISERRFLHALNYCMLLPGPEAQQLATYIGWLMHRTAGGLVAGGLFILPGVIALLALSMIYFAYGTLPVVAGAFFGLNAAVLAIVVEALLRIGRRGLTDRARRGIALLAFLGIFFCGVPFPAIILAAGLFGAMTAEGRGADAAPGADAATVVGEAIPAHARPAPRRTALTLVIGLTLWFLPTLTLLALLGAHNRFTSIALFFSKVAVLTFGGAYAILAYVAQEVVGTAHWLTPREMIDGLGMAETTPGPLIMVVQYVGFVAATRAPSGLPPLLAGTLGGLLTSWVTFVPSFLWVFLGGPYMEALRGNRRLAGALSAITAAVVGVILNLAVWFAIHTLFGATVRIAAGPFQFEAPRLATLDGARLVLALAAALAIFRWRLGMLPTLALSALAGLAMTIARS